MSRFDPYLAARRFGTGLGPSVALPRTAEDFLTDLQGADSMAQAFPVVGYDDYLLLDEEIRILHQAQKRAVDEAAKEPFGAQIRAHKATAGDWMLDAFKAQLARGVAAPTGFRERLSWFWADHFTVRGMQGLALQAVPTFVEGAIRPHLAGSFADMLGAVARHPIMLNYLDQARSSGPNSPFARRRGRGLNENYARELIELHTLGPDGGYSQRDVTELARLLAGLTIRRGAFQWEARMAEPGEKHVLAKTYSGPTPREADVDAVLADLAVHPDTARHLARKLAVHFVSDRPDPALIEAMAAAYLEAEGRLEALYRVLLRHPAAQAGEGGVKWPLEYIVSALRALGVRPEMILQAERRDLRRAVLIPLQVMGQPHSRPSGPDGWAEADAAWITPQGIAGRISWAMRAPGQMLEALPDPRAFVETALGPAVPEPVRFAARSAENRREGVGLVLASPAFQRR